MIPPQRIKIAKRLSWSKDGWTKSNQPGYIPPRSKIDSSISDQDFTFDNRMPEVEMFSEARAKIQIGSCQEALDLLPPSMQYIIRDPSNWWFSNDGKLFKAVDPETQAKGRPEQDRKAEWGYDADEQFKESTTYQKLDKSALKWLEDHKFQMPESSREDILGRLDEENYDFTLARPLPQLDVDIAKICIDQYNNTISEREEIAELDETNIEDLVDYFNKIQTRIVNSLNSSQCASGYTPPKLRWDRCYDIATNSTYTDAKELREARFHNYYNQIMSCKNMDQLYGLVHEEDGEFSRGGGIYGKLRQLFQQDKELIVEWSTEDLYENGKLVQKSALTKAREAKIEELRQFGHDEETIRKVLWHEFDKERKITPAVYKDGILVTETKKTSDSRWCRERSEAFQELNFTKLQKQALFQATQKVRLKFTRGDDLDLRDKINLAFQKVHTLNTLKIFKNWLYKRSMGYIETYQEDPKTKAKTLKTKKKTYKIGDAIIDKLSISQTIKLENALARREKHIKQRNNFFLKLDKITARQEGIITNLPEVGAECHHESCSCWVVDVPKFIAIEGDKGYLYLECDCGKKVWLTPFKEIESKEERLEKWMKKYQ